MLGETTHGPHRPVLQPCATAAVDAVVGRGAKPRRGGHHQAPQRHRTVRRAPVRGGHGRAGKRAGRYEPHQRKRHHPAGGPCLPGCRGLARGDSQRNGGRVVPAEVHGPRSHGAVGDRVSKPGTRVRRRSPWQGCICLSCRCICKAVAIRPAPQHVPCAEHNAVALEWDQVCLPAFPPCPDGQTLLRM